MRACLGHPEQVSKSESKYTLHKHDIHCGIQPYGSHPPERTIPTITAIVTTDPIAAFTNPLKSRPPRNNQAAIKNAVSAAVKAASPMFSTYASTGHIVGFAAKTTPPNAIAAHPPSHMNAPHANNLLPATECLH